jgi:hypothetical protein
LSAFAIAQPLRAQSRLGIDRAAIEGTVIDSTTGRPPLKTMVCPVMNPRTIWNMGPCAYLDSLGHYVLHNLLLTEVRISVQCEMARAATYIMATDTIRISEPKLHSMDWKVATTGCDKRPVRIITGTFSGFWKPGFESAEFIPCPADSWQLPSDSLPPNYNSQAAWAWLGKNTHVPKWPSAPRDEWGVSRYYVTWHGTLEGPGHYGHMSIANFSFIADSVIEIRAPKSGDCGLGSSDKIAR